MLDKTNTYKNKRGERSNFLFVTDSKNYYKGIKIIQWHWFVLLKYIKNKLIRRV